MRFEVSPYGSYLATRDTGAKVRDELERDLRRVAAGTTVEVSFADVKAVTISFADEFLGKLITERSTGLLSDVALVLTKLNDEVREALQVCLERRDVVAAHRHARTYELLGATDDIVEETYERARARKEFRASELADDLRISPQNVNNRLKRLADAGALIRTRTAPEGGGKEFVYRVPR